MKQYDDKMKQADQRQEAIQNGQPNWSPPAVGATPGQEPEDEAQDNRSKSGCRTKQGQDEWRDQDWTGSRHDKENRVENEKQWPWFSFFIALRVRHRTT